MWTNSEISDDGLCSLFSFARRGFLIEGAKENLRLTVEGEKLEKEALFGGGNAEKLGNEHKR